MALIFDSVVERVILANPHTSSNSLAEAHCKLPPCSGALSFVTTNSALDNYFPSPNDSPRQAAAIAARSSGVTSASLTLSATIRVNS